MGIPEPSWKGYALILLATPVWVPMLGVSWLRERFRHSYDREYHPERLGYEQKPLSPPRGATKTVHRKSVIDSILLRAFDRQKPGRRHHQQQSPLFRLPLEIRQQIYRDVVQLDTNIQIIQLQGRLRSVVWKNEAENYNYRALGSHGQCNAPSYELEELCKVQNVLPPFSIASLLTCRQMQVNLLRCA